MVSVIGFKLKESATCRSPERPVFLLSGSVEKVISSTRQKRRRFWKQRHSY